MRILSLVILFIVLYLSNQKTESPHGSEFKVSCKTCHSAKGWQLDKEIYSFDHSKTKLPLTGQHTEINCRLCHKTLIFSAAKSECNQCHNDIHQNSVGLDCSRCHTPESWLVNNITDIHRTSRFPLVGAHVTAECIQCHKSESLLRFDVPGVNCIDCHREDYMATTSPNHVQSGISDECSTCHPVNSLQWTGAGFNHNFFPLTQGHAMLKCNDCHTTGNYTDAKSDCYSCHAVDYNNAVNPNHKTSGFPTTCTQCHTTNPDWKPASYPQHDAREFPIYSGKHRGQWNNCNECHTNLSNYSVYSCITCHEHNKPDMDSKHSGRPGYSYNSVACYTCHPRGNAD